MENRSEIHNVREGPTDHGTRAPYWSGRTGFVNGNSSAPSPAAHRRLIRRLALPFGVRLGGIGRNDVNYWRRLGDDSGDFPHADIIGQVDRVGMRATDPSFAVLTEIHWWREEHRGTWYGSGRHRNGLAQERTSMENRSDLQNTNEGLIRHGTWDPNWSNRMVYGIGPGGGAARADDAGSHNNSRSLGMRAADDSPRDNETDIQLQGTTDRPNRAAWHKKAGPPHTGAADRPARNTNGETDNRISRTYAFRLQGRTRVTQHGVLLEKDVAGNS